VVVSGGKDVAGVQCSFDLFKIVEMIEHGVKQNQKQKEKQKP